MACLRLVSLARNAVAQNADEGMEEVIFDQRSLAWQDCIRQIFCVVFGWSIEENKSFHQVPKVWKSDQKKRQKKLLFHFTVGRSGEG